MVGIFFKGCCSHRAPRRRLLSTVAQSSSKCTRSPQDPQQGDLVGLFLNSGISGSLRDWDADSPSPMNSSLNWIGFVLLLRLSCPPTRHNPPASPGWVTLYEAGVLSSQTPLRPQLGCCFLQEAFHYPLPPWIPCMHLVLLPECICIRAQLKGRQESCVTHLPSPEPNRAWHTVGTQTMCVG